VSRTLWTWARLLGAVAILAVLVWRLGTGPFLDGLQTVDARALAAGAVLALVTTVAAAWRWRLVARGLGVDLPLPAAVAAYYRSQFLNTVLPGGVVGDVHRGVSHGRDVGDVGRGLRAVAWERTAGQGVQAVLTVCLLLVAPSPVRASMPLVAGGLLVAILVVAVLARVLPRRGHSRGARALRVVDSDVREGLLASHAWPGIVLASVVVVTGHMLTFIVAARTAGTTGSTLRLAPLTLLVLLAMVLPSVAGWGPREGVAAWVFAAAGLGMAQGVETTVVYGVMVLVAYLPGAGVLVVSWLSRRRAAGEARDDVVDLRRDPVPAGAGGFDAAGPDEAARG